MRYKGLLQFNRGNIFLITVSDLKTNLLVGNHGSAKIMENESCWDRWWSWEEATCSIVVDPGHFYPVQDPENLNSPDPGSRIRIFIQ